MHIVQERAHSLAAAGLLLRLLACLQCPAQARALPALPLAQLAAEDDLQVGMQRVVDEAAAKYSISLGLGFVDGEHSFGLGAGPAGPAGQGNVSQHSTFIMGSGTKPYVSVAVLRLVDKGLVSLDDPASLHMDPVMKRMWNSSFEKLFGARTKKVTVGALLRMQSGLGDFDCGPWDDITINTPKGSVHSPLSDLQYLSNLTGPADCRVSDQCTWSCEPQSCTTYSSVNYLLAGLVALRHAGTTSTWETYDQRTLLGAHFAADYPQTRFPTVGALPSQGLNTVGHCDGRFEKVDIYGQDASIEGWCNGNALTTPMEAAQFTFDLLGPGPNKFLSAAALAAMKNFTALDTGWSAGDLLYGAGLEVRNVAAVHESPPNLNGTAPCDLASFVGHDGESYGFLSNQGFFPKLNASISLFSSQDKNTNVNYEVTCKVVKLVARHKHLPGADSTSFKCPGE